MGSTVTHSRRQRDRAPASRPPSQPFGHSAPLCLPPHPLRSSGRPTLVTIQNTKNATQYPQLKILICVQCRREINIRPKAAVNWTYFLPCIASEITRTRERIESGQELCVVAPRSTARPDPSTVDESIKSMT